MYIPAHLFIGEKLFLKVNNQIWHWKCKPIYFTRVLNAFWKRALHMYVCKYIFHVQERCLQRNGHCYFSVLKGQSWTVCLLLFYALATSMVISGQVLTPDSAHSWRPFSVSPLGDHVTSSLTCYPTHSHYPDTEPTSPYPCLIMKRSWLGNVKY